jgi:hypothetical protein
LVDCADGGCSASSACETGDALCSDMLDNDGDGFTDCEDFGCLTPSVTVCP